jgi:hypothetical protein
MRASLLFFAAVHAVALLTMLLLLRPGMDAATFSALERARYVAENAQAWRLGWLPWQLSALSDLWVSAAFWRAALRWLGARAVRRFGAARAVGRGSPGHVVRRLGCERCARRPGSVAA